MSRAISSGVDPKGAGKSFAPKKARMRALIKHSKEHFLYRSEGFFVAARSSWWFLVAAAGLLRVAHHAEKVFGALQYSKTLKNYLACFSPKFSKLVPRVVCRVMEGGAGIFS